MKLKWHSTEEILLKTPQTSVVGQFGKIHQTGAILKDFSPEGSRAHRHNSRAGT
jgi:hypothetical protein